MKYPDIVAQAREDAKRFNIAQIVYQVIPDGHTFGAKFAYCNKDHFEQRIAIGKEALVRLLLITPSGAISQ